MKNAVKQVNGNKARILRFVADFEGECGCGPSIDWIAYGLRMNQRTTLDYMNRLKRYGMIIVKKHQDQESGGKGSRNIIHLYVITEQARAVLEREA